jgi:hypothetical protein
MALVLGVNLRRSRERAGNSKRERIVRRTLRPPTAQISDESGICAAVCLRLLWSLASNISGVLNSRRYDPRQLRHSRRSSGAGSPTALIRAWRLLLLLYDDPGRAALSADHLSVRALPSRGYTAVVLGWRLIGMRRVAIRRWRGASVAGGSKRV